MCIYSRNKVTSNIAGNQVGGCCILTACNSKTSECVFSSLSFLTMHAYRSMMIYDDVAAAAACRSAYVCLSWVCVLYTNCVPFTRDECHQNYILNSMAYKLELWYFLDSMHHHHHHHHPSRKLIALIGFMAVELVFFFLASHLISFNFFCTVFISVRHVDNAVWCVCMCISINIVIYLLLNAFMQ